MGAAQQEIQFVQTGQTGGSPVAVAPAPAPERAETPATGVGLDTAVVLRAASEKFQAEIAEKAPEQALQMQRHVELMDANIGGVDLKYDRLLEALKSTDTEAIKKAEKELRGTRTDYESSFSTLSGVANKYAPDSAKDFLDAIKKHHDAWFSGRDIEVQQARAAANLPPVEAAKPQPLVGGNANQPAPGDAAQLEVLKQKTQRSEDALKRKADHYEQAVGTLRSVFDDKDKGAFDLDLNKVNQGWDNVDKAYGTLSEAIKAENVDAATKAHAAFTAEIAKLEKAEQGIAAPLKLTSIQGEKEVKDFLSARSELLTANIGNMNDEIRFALEQKGIKPEQIGISEGYGIVKFLKSWIGY